MTATLSLWDKRALIFVEGNIPTAAREACVEACRFESEGHEYSDAWKRGDWDGYIELFRETSHGNWCFPIGLLSKVTRILDLHGVDYLVEGLTRPGRGDIEYDWDAPFTLREYQEDAVADALQAGTGIISMPTGSGKTTVGLRYIHELQHPALVAMHQTEIAEQWVERIQDRLGCEVNRVFGGDWETGAPVTVALYQSIYQDGEVRDHPTLDAPVAVFDECHRVSADTFEEVALSSSAVYRLGLSATPERDDNSTLKVIGGTGELICDIDVEDLIEAGYIAEPTWRLLDPPRLEGRFRDWQSEYKKGVVEHSARNDMLAAEIEDVPKPCLCTVEQINHGDRLAALAEDRGVDVAFIHGSASSREENVSAFREGDLDVLISTAGIVGEGFDIPEIEAFVLAGGRKARGRTLQQVGRGLRPDSDEAVIVDCLDKGSTGYKSWIGEHAEERLRVYQNYFGAYGPQ